MGVDLDFLMVDGDYSNAGNYRTACSWNILESPRDYHLYGRIADLPRIEIKHDEFMSYRGTVPDGLLEGESCYGETREDRYGRPIEFVNSKDLASVMDSECSQQAPIKAYLSLINKSVGLYWH